MDVICEACGVTNKSPAEFCTACGHFLGWREPGNQPDSGSQPQSQRTPVVMPVDDHQPPARPAPIKPAIADQAVLDQARTQTIELSKAPAGPVCPTCWRVNEPGRRFCAKCGSRIAATQAGPARGGDPTDLRRQERVNERAFHDSLPAIYRWRRVGLVALAIAVVGALAITVGANPVGWARARWYDIRGTLALVPGVQATVLPPTSGNSAKAGSTVDPAFLVDGTAADWHVHWTADEAGTSCDGGTGVPTIELAMAQPIRIRAIGIYGGLAADQPQRALQFRPRTLGITAIDAGGCRLVTVQDSADLQRISFDTKQPVSVIRISLDSAYPGPADAQKRLSIREIQLFSRPQ